MQFNNKINSKHLRCHTFKIIIQCTDPLKMYALVHSKIEQTKFHWTHMHQCIWDFTPVQESLDFYASVHTSYVPIQNTLVSEERFHTVQTVHSLVHNFQLHLAPVQNCLRFLQTFHAPIHIFWKLWTGSFPCMHRFKNQFLGKWTFQCIFAKKNNEKLNQTLT
jgi:hypothetical protein